MSILVEYQSAISTVAGVVSAIAAVVPLLRSSKLQASIGSRGRNHKALYAGVGFAAFFVISAVAYTIVDRSIDSFGSDAAPSVRAEDIRIDGDGNVVVGNQIEISE